MASGGREGTHFSLFLLQSYLFSVSHVLDAPPPPTLDDAPRDAVLSRWVRGPLRCSRQTPRPQRTWEGAW
mgnify:CR=1 FL=1